MLGAIAFLLGLYGTALLPVTIVGIVLLLAAIGLMVAEAHLPTGGVLGIAGVVAFVASGLLLYNTGSDAFEVSAPVVIVVGLALGSLLAFAVQRTVAAHRTQPRTGWEEMIGAEGEVRLAIDPIGRVFAEGALWRAEAVEQGKRIEIGYRVRVEAIEGLTLHVRPIPRQHGDRQEGTGAEQMEVEKGTR